MVNSVDCCGVIVDVDHCQGGFYTVNESISPAKIYVSRTNIPEGTRERSVPQL